MKFDFNKYEIYTADFETSTPEWGEQKARVWLWDICNENLVHKTGRTIEEFFDYISHLPYTKKPKLYCFHNLAYDGMYILSYLFRNNFKYVEEREKDMPSYTFSTVISDMGQHYAYTVKFRKEIVYFMDSFKFIHMSIKKIGELYNLPIKKGEIDYTTLRPKDYIATEEEIDYIHNDTEIAMRAMKVKIEQGETKFTQAGNAKFEFRKTFDEDSFTLYFPEIDCSLDYELRRAYFGGFTYLNPKKRGLDLGECISVDCNSMYPAQMLHEAMPFGYPVYFAGKYNEDKNYPLYIQRFRCIFKLKEGKTPMIQKRKVFTRSVEHEYLESSDFYTVELVLCNVDLELFFDNYHVWKIEYLDGYKFMSRKGHEMTPEECDGKSVDYIIENDGKGSFFYNYFKKWRYIKEHTEGAMRTNAKLMQNALYGVFSTNPLKRHAIPMYNKEYDMVHFERSLPQEEKGFYLPIGIFITAYARKLLINLINKNKERFVYCDTDSIYLEGHTMPEGVKIHNTLYGYFKIEHIITKARFLGAKRYIYLAFTQKNPVEEWTVVCCGADEYVKQQMSWENFKAGQEFYGKKSVKTVSGGKHIVTSTYKLDVR